MGFLGKLRTGLNRLVLPTGFEIARINHAMMHRAIWRLPGHGFSPRTIIDVGAAVGGWTALVSAAFPEARILMIEALQEREEALRKIARQDPQRYLVHIGAAGSGSGTVAFNVSADFDGSAVVTSGHKSSTPVRRVSMEPIDGLIQKYALEAPYLLKLDTHGFEVPILQGAKEALQATEVVIMECYFIRSQQRQQLFWEMVSFMNDLGFQCFDLVDPLLRPCDQSLWQVDLFFARREWPGFARSEYT